MCHTDNCTHCFVYPNSTVLNFILWSSSLHHTSQFPAWVGESKLIEVLFSKVSRTQPRAVELFGSVELIRGVVCRSSGVPLAWSYLRYLRCICGFLFFFLLAVVSRPLPTPGKPESSSARAVSIPRPSCCASCTPSLVVYNAGSSSRA